jgi:hypothetical protein
MCKIELTPTTTEPPNISNDAQSKLASNSNASNAVRKLEALFLDIDSLQAPVPNLDLQKLPWLSYTEFVEEIDTNPMCADLLSDGIPLLGDPELQPDSAPTWPKKMFSHLFVLDCKPAHKDATHFACISRVSQLQDSGIFSAR